MAVEKYPLNPILTPINYEERQKILENWQRITRYFNSVEGQIKLLAGGKEVEELLQSIESAITNAQNVTTSTQIALNNVANALSQLNTVISNANTATNRANAAADDANTLNIALTSLKGHLETLQNDLTGIVQAENQRVTNEGNRVQAEGVRVDAESLRNDAELVRKQSEVIRNESEDLRGQNETVRKNAETERANAEQLRIDKEAERIENESLRISAEDNRIDVEQERVDAEIIRKKNEVDRVGNENVRGNKENERLQAETERINNEVTREQHEQLRQAAYVLLNELLQNMESLAYDYEETYNFPNFVSYNGSTFIALKEVQGITPIGDGVNYRLVAQRGVDGTGAVSSVNGLSPDPNGNVNLIINYINNLNSERIDAGLSASMGKLLMSLITALQNDKADLSFIVDEIAREIAALVNEAPETLNTINALAQALGEDPNFAVTIMAMLGEKATNTDLTTLSTTVTTHLGENVLSEDGAHNIRYFEDVLSVKEENGDWQAISSGTGIVDFYNNGNEALPLTGGWIAQPPSQGTYVLQKNSNHLFLDASGTTGFDTFATYKTANVVDLSKISTLNVQIELLINNPFDIYYPPFVLDIRDASDKVIAHTLHNSAEMLPKTIVLSIDVSAMYSGRLTIYVLANGMPSYRKQVKVTQVWGGK